jgi:rod shape-determining protein MreD
MMPSWQSRALRLLLGLTPTVLSLLLVVISAVPLGLPYLSNISPLLAMMSVYYWSIYRADLMPAPAAFLIGLVQDLVGGGPLGLMALVLLLVHGLCVSQRRVFLSKPFLVGWWGFMFVAAGAAVVAWTLACLYFVSWFDPRPVAAQLVLTVALYPPLTWLFSRTETRLLRAN